MVLTGASEGLTSLNDPIQVYELYGSTGDSLRQQLQRCAPVNGDGGQYSGETSYSLTWQYSYLSGNGSCNLTDVKVGLHTSSILPMWRTSAAASPQLTQAWTSFIAGLTAHESGHTSIDNQYASRLTHDLQNLKAESCDNLASLARTTINTEVQALNQANAAYDIATNHGATQGAVANF
jgi:predicted secreted Zn-dependent protease